MDFMLRQEFTKGDSRMRRLPTGFRLSTTVASLNGGYEGVTALGLWSVTFPPHASISLTASFQLGSFSPDSIALIWRWGIPLRRAGSNCESPAAARDSWRFLANDCLAPNSTGAPTPSATESHDLLHQGLTKPFPNRFA